MSNRVTSWPIVSLFDLCNPKQWPTIHQAAFVEHGYPVYGANGKIGYYTEYNHANPTVLITCRGATCGTINVCEPKSYVTGNAMALDELDESRVSAEYLVHALRKVGLTKAISGTAQPQITRQSLAAIFVPLPPLPEQRRIADVLDKADALRGKRRTSIEMLTKMPQAIFFTMFGDPATNPHDYPKQALVGLVREGDSINYGVVQPGENIDNGVPLVRVSDLVDGRVSQTSIKRIAPSIERNYKRSRLCGDEILVSCVGSTGVVATADESLKGFNIARAVARIPLAKTVNRIFLAEYLKTETVQRYFANELRTVSQPTLNIKQLAETQIVLPPADLQAAFALRVSALQEVVVKQQSSNLLLSSLFTSLQHRAFAGTL